MLLAMFPPAAPDGEDGEAEATFTPPAPAEVVVRAGVKVESVLTSRVVEAGCWVFILS